MEYEDLVDVYYREQTGQTLTLLAPGFYGSVVELARRLNNERKTCSNYRERESLDDLIKNIRILYEGVYERRRGKILEFVKLGIVPEYMLPAETEFYDRVSGCIADLQNIVMASLDDAFEAKS